MNGYAKARAKSNWPLNRKALSDPDRPFSMDQSLAGRIARDEARAAKQAACKPHQWEKPIFGVFYGQDRRQCAKCGVLEPEK